MGAFEPVFPSPSPCGVESSAQSHRIPLGPSHTHNEVRIVDWDGAAGGRDGRLLDRPHIKPHGPRRHCRIRNGFCKSSEKLQKPLFLGIRTHSCGASLAYRDVQLRFFRDRMPVSRRCASKAFKERATAESRPNMVLPSAVLLNPVSTGRADSTAPGSRNPQSRPRKPARSGTWRARGRRDH